MWQYIIPALALIIVQIIISLKQQRVQDVKTDNMLGILKDDISRLEKAQTKHNEIVERTYKLESDMKTCFKRIDEIRDDIKEVRKNEH